MAAVPEGATLPSEQQQVGGVPSIHANSPETMFSALGEGLQSLGQSTEKFSDVMAQHAMQVAALNNKALSDQAYTSYLNDAGALEAKFQMDNRSVDPAQATTRYQDYVGQLEQLRQHYRGTLGNMMASSLFDQDSRRMQGYMIMNGSKTIAQGTHTFREAAFNGSQATLTARAAASQDPAEQEEIKQQIATSAYNWGRSEGLPEDAIKADILRRTSQVDMSIIDGMMKTQPENAWTYFQAHRNEMTVEHIGATEEKLDQALTVHGGYVAATQAMAGVGTATAAAPAAMAGSAEHALPEGAPHGGLTPHMAGLEAGIMQAFPGTRPTSEGRTAGQNAAVHGAQDSAHMAGNAVDFHIPAGMTGQQFAEAIKEKFPQANVLYEGPGAAHSTAPHVHVQLGRQGMGGNGYLPGTAGSQLDAIQGNAQNLFRAADQAADAYAAKYGLDPIMVRYQAEQKLQSDMNRMEYQFRQQEDSSKQNILTAISAGGQDGEPIGDLPTLFRLNPGMQDDYNNLTGSDRRAVQAYLRQGANTLTPGRQLQWEQISGMNSQQVMALNPLDPKLDLTTSQRTQLTNTQHHLREQAARQQEHDARIAPITSNKIIHQALVDSGIVDSDNTISDEQSYQVFIGRMLQAEDNWAAAHPTHKGAIPDQELINMAQPILARRGVQAPNQLFGINIPFTGNKGETPPVIPPDRYEWLRQQYMKAFPDAGEPSAEQIGREYEHRRERGLER